jgi:putative transposase
MVSPAHRRDAVGWAQAAYQVSERRACHALVVHRALVRYASVKPDDTPVRRRLHELALARPSFGVKRLHVMLRRDGRPINHKKTRRRYVEEGLQLRPRRRRRRAATVRQPRAVVTQANARWAMDFMQDMLATGETIRVFTLVDVGTRECLALDVARRFRGTDVARLLTEAGERRGTLPPIIQCDNGTEFTSTALDHWAYWNRVQLDFSRPGKPVDNSVCEAFNGSVRRECLTRHWFASLVEARTELETWREDSTNHRPHTSLGLHPPARYWSAGSHLPRAPR